MRILQRHNTGILMKRGDLFTGYGGVAPSFGSLKPGTFLLYAAVLQSASVPIRLQIHLAAEFAVDKNHIPRNEGIYLQDTGGSTLIRLAQARHVSTVRGGPAERAE